MEPYERIEHTADIGIKAYGKDLKELFANAVKGLISILLPGARISHSLDHPIDIKGKDLKELFVNLLEEVLYQLNVKKFITGSISIIRLGKFELTAKLSGEPLDINKHQIEYDIKGVTFHQLKFEKEDDLLTVSVIFDI